MNPPDIDWNQPWLQDWRGVGQGVERAVAGGVSVAAALNAAIPSAPSTTPVRFVPQSDLPPNTAYEDFIFKSGCVPTRDNPHDFFNGLCWLHLPLAKQKLNQLQAQQIALAGVAPVRGPARDALTLFDENAALLRAPDALWQALQRRDWAALFGDLRPLWSQARLWLFGHALLEKLVMPRIAITAHVYRVAPPTDTLESLDTWLAQDLSAEKLATKPFAPLPVLGTPHWWPANENPSFYADTQIFRPPR